MEPRHGKQPPRSAGFSLVEVLVTLAVLTIVAAIAVSTLTRARDRSRQGATIADMRNIASAIEAYSVDHTLLPGTAAFADVAKLLEPYHGKNMPTVDHWGHVYSYFRTDERNYSLISLGKDGIAGLPISPLTRTEFERDIVVSSGRFAGL